MRERLYHIVFVLSVSAFLRPSANCQQADADGRYGNGKTTAGAVAGLGSIKLARRHIQSEYGGPDGLAAVSDYATIPISVLPVCYVLYGKGGAVGTLYLYEATAVTAIYIPLTSFIAAKLHLKGYILAGAHRYAVAVEMILSAAVVGGFAGWLGGAGSEHRYTF